MSKCIMHCKYSDKEYPNITFFEFPNDTNRKELWLAAMRRLNWNLPKDSYLCSKHFHNKFKTKIPGSPKVHLAENAIPTIFFDAPKRRVRKLNKVSSTNIASTISVDRTLIQSDKVEKSSTIQSNENVKASYQRNNTCSDNAMPDNQIETPNDEIKYKPPISDDNIDILLTMASIILDHNYMNTTRNPTKNLTLNKSLDSKSISTNLYIGEAIQGITINEWINPSEQLNSIATVEITEVPSIIADYSQIDQNENSIDPVFNPRQENIINNETSNKKTTDQEQIIDNSKTTDSTMDIASKHDISDVKKEISDFTEDNETEMETDSTTEIQNDPIMLADFVNFEMICKEEKYVIDDNNDDDDDDDDDDNNVRNTIAIDKKVNQSSTSGIKPINELKYELANATELPYYIEELDPDTELVRCDMCGQYFENDYCVQKHIQLVHKIEEQFPCPECPKVMKFKSTFTSHLKIHHPHRCFKCDFCIQIFVSKYYFMQHREHHILEKVYTCEVCPKRFAQKELFDIHSYIHKESQDHVYQKTYECEICGKALGNKSALNIHLKVHFENEEYHCDSCPLMFFSWQSMVQHRRSHTLYKPFKCDVCPKRFYTKLLLRYHSYEHNGEKIQCDVCSKQCANVTSLKSHMKTHLIDKEFKCLKCNETFSVYSSLLEHKKTHISSVECYRCDLCFDVFNNRCGLRRHRKRAHKNVEYVCDICSKICPNLAIIRSHMLCHKEKKEWKFVKVSMETEKKQKSRKQCKICGKVFNGNSYLNQHLSTHSGAKEYKCEYCPKKFYIESLLHYHIFKHTGFKDFLCNICMKEYSTKSCLKLHKRYKHSLYSCDHCSDTFSEESELVGHLSAVHNEHAIKWERKKEIKNENCENDIKSESGEIKLNSDEMKLNPEDIKFNVKDIKINPDEIKLNPDNIKCEQNIPINDSMPNGSMKHNCKICLAKFKRFSLLKSHTIRRHPNKKISIGMNRKKFVEFEKPYKCDTCKHTFTTRGNIFQHIITRHNPQFRPYICNICDRKFIDETDAVNHVHDKVYKCDVCLKKFKYFRLIVEHMLVHQTDLSTQLKSNICALCKKEFSTMVGLKIHIKIKHSNRNNLLCTECNKKFIDETTMMNHKCTKTEKIEKKTDMEVDDVKPLVISDATIKANQINPIMYKCKVCALAFKRFSLLKTHCVKDHSKEIGEIIVKREPKIKYEKPYKCYECQKTFNSRGNIFQHITIRHDSGFKPYICKVCGKKFLDEDDARDHIHDKLYNCSICSKTFKMLRLLKEHMEFHEKSENGNKNGKNFIGNVHRKNTEKKIKIEIE